MRLLRLAAASTLIVALCVGAWAAVYAYDKGLSKKWRRLIIEEFNRRGVETEIGKVTIDPFQGLVARDVKIFADEDRRTLLASADNVTLDIDFAKLIRKKQFLNTVELRDADISLPVDPTTPGGERLEIRDFSARIRLPENKIEIDSAECDFHGVRVTLTGSLLQPQPGDGRRGDLAAQLEQIRERRQHFALAVEELQRFRFGPQPPHLHVEVIGDLDRPEGIEATATLTGAHIERGSYRCDELEIRAEYRHPEILIDQLKITDSAGELYADAHWRIGTGTVPFRVESSIDARGLLGAFLDIQALGELVFYSPPNLGAAGELLFGADAEAAGVAPGSGSPALRMSGTFECGRVGSHGKIFDGAYAEFSVSPEKWYVRNLLLEHLSGTASADVLYDAASGLRYRAQIAMDPTAFTPFFKTESTKAFLRRFQFDSKNPTINVSAKGSGPGLDPTTWTTSGEFILGPCRYRNVPVLNATGNYEISGPEMSFSDFRVTRPEGRIDGDAVHVDGEAGLVTVEGIRGSVYPADTAAYFAPKTARYLRRYKFLSPPQVTLDGVIDAREGGTRSDFTANFSSGAPASFELFDREFAVTAPTGSVRVQGEEVTAGVRAGIFGGRAEYRGQSGLATRAGNHSGRLEVGGLEFGRVAEHFEIDTETSGSLEGHLAFQIAADDPGRWSGSGAAKLAGGDVFAVPVMGPLSRLISGVLDRPKAGYSVATEASATFGIERGVIRSEDFTALAPGFTLRAKGQIDTVADTVDVDAEMNARGPLRLVGWPLSKLLKYKCEGPLDEPHWRPVNFSLPRGEDSGSLSSAVTSVPRTAVDVGERTLGAGAKIVGGGARVVGEGAKALGEGAIAVGEGAMHAVGEARDLIPVPRLIPRRGKEGAGGSDREDPMQDDPDRTDDPPQ